MGRDDVHDCADEKRPASHFETRNGEQNDDTERDESSGKYAVDDARTKGATFLYVRTLEPAT